jgi:hypothetical protein
MVIFLKHEESVEIFLPIISVKARLDESMKA